jgi:peptidoglycan/LPS O-acetylase OafA/YrhL
LKYRAEIDGLRAIAVVPVILFHAGFEIFSGGFVGVDVFFVISGYLITKILIGDIENNRFSIISFYERRARRILPALFFVMLLCIPFAWMWMLPDPLENFGQSIVATTLFANNILLFITSNYWDLASEFKPLLHTWSLAVEEQYYILFPVFLLLVWQFGKNKVFWITAILLAISLILSEWSWRNNPTANFYLAPTRAWELLFGSMVALTVKRYGVRDSNILSFLGLIAIIFSILFYDETTPVPSIYALVPVLGTALIILYANKQTLVAKLLSTKILVGIGLISYSAYLWHQPLFVFSKIYFQVEPSYIFKLLLIIITGIFAAFTWRFVEQPFRDKKLISSRVAISLMVIIAALLLLFGYSAHKSHGFMSRVFDENTISNDMYISYNQRSFEFKKDKYGDEGLPNVLVVGNSFGRDVVNILRETYKVESTVNLIYRDDFNDCSIAESDLGLNIFSNADLILFASNYSLETDSCINDLITMAGRLDIKILFIGKKHFGYNLNWVTRIDRNRRSFLRNPVLDEIIAEDMIAEKIIPKANYLSIMSKISNSEGVLITDENGNLLSGDRTHLTKYGAIYIGKKVFRNSPIDEIILVP